MKIFIILGILAGLLIIGPKILRESEYFSIKSSLKSKKSYINGATINADQKAAD